MKKIIRNKNLGILFWITGLSGSGKTTIARRIKKQISDAYGPTLLISGDDIRKIFKLNKYSYKDRVEISKMYTKFARFITCQNINLIFAAVGMMHSLRNSLKKNIDNYVEIYIKADVNKIIDLKKKKLYHKKNPGKIVGISIKPEFPKNPDILIENNFKKSTDDMAKILFKTVRNLI